MSEPTTLESLTLVSIAESAQSAATLAGLGDAMRAQEALDRAEARLALFAADKPAHARNVRLAREAVGHARRAVAIMASHTDTRREKQHQVRAARRAVLRAKA